MIRGNIKMNIKRLVSIVLLILGGYYLLVAIGIVPTEIVIFDYSLNRNALAIISLLIIAVALFLDDDWRKKIKNAFS